jgi:hypothetical protein
LLLKGEKGVRCGERLRGGEKKKKKRDRGEERDGCVTVLVLLSPGARDWAGRWTTDNSVRNTGWTMGVACGIGDAGGVYM